MTTRAISLSFLFAFFLVAGGCWDNSNAPKNATNKDTIKGVVLEKIYIPSYPRWLGEAYVPTPEGWVVKVAVDGRTHQVSVSKKYYETVIVGDTIKLRWFYWGKEYVIVESQK